ncbi:MAG: response regulator [Chloroflexi bacterium]|nr:response regulator [Chloroflexota bacterium]
MDKKLAMIVEDNIDAAEIFDAALTNAGFKTEVIGDGQEALDRLEEVTPALLLLDLHLPSVSGDVIFDRVIEDERFTDVRIIIASADGQLATYQSNKNKEKLIIMQKPVSYDHLTIMAQRLNQ